MQTTQKSLTIVGMGMAGLGCAWNLSKNSSQINLLLVEKSSKLGGRATSNSRQGYIYDHGANYFTFEGLSNPQRLRNIIQKELPSDDLTHIQKELYLFDSTSKIYQPKQAPQQEKLTYKKGLLQLAELLQKDQDLNIKFEQHVEKVQYCSEKKKWNVIYTDKTNNNKTETITSDFVLFTPPAPQIVELFSKSEYSKRDNIIKLFEKCQYKKQICSVIAFDKKIKNLPYFALLNEDRNHEIVWITVEDEKDGHVPQDKSLLICQMSESFSERVYGQSDEEVKKQVYEQLSKLIPEVNEQQMLEHIKFSWIKRWKYALPKSEKVSEESLVEFQEDGLFFAGDFLIGRGRVLQAFEKGLLVSDMIQSKL